MDLPLIVALFTFLADCCLASSAVFLYLNSREALQTWRRRADGTSATADLKQIPKASSSSCKTAISGRAGMVRPNESALQCRGSSSDSPPIDQRGLSIAGKPRCFFSGPSSSWPCVIVCLIAVIPAKLLGFPSVSNLVFYYVLAAACGYYAPSALVEKGDCTIGRMRCNGRFLMPWI